MHPIVEKERELSEYLGTEAGSGEIYTALYRGAEEGADSKAGHSLLVISDLLSTTELNDENIGYWLNNSNLTRLIYLEF